MRIISKKPDKEVKKTVTCRGCGSKIEYVPNDIVVLWSGRDISQAYDETKGFKCPVVKCGKDIIIYHD